MLREFKFERENQWLGTKRMDLKNWTPDTWARVYGFQRGVRAGLAGRKDRLFVRKFQGDVDPKEGLHPSKCRNPREMRVLEFLMPILYPEKPKRISLTMANNMFGALFGVRPVNRGLLIHEIVGRTLPNIGEKPSYLSLFILHLYKHYDYIKPEEEALLTIVMEEVTYKVRPTAADSSTSSDPIIPDAPPSSPGSPSSQRPPSSPSRIRRTLSPPLPSPPQQPPQPEAGPIRDSIWRNMDSSGWEIPEAPFKRVHDELTELQTQFHRLKHIIPGASQALGGCGPGNILREIAKRANRKELEEAKRELNQARMDNAQFHAQMASMADELGQKSGEIQKYHAEQTVIFGRIRELVGHPGEIANKARLYD